MFNNNDTLTSDVDVVGLEMSEDATTASQVPNVLMINNPML